MPDTMEAISPDQNPFEQQNGKLFEKSQEIFEEAAELAGAYVAETEKAVFEKSAK